MNRSESFWGSRIVEKVLASGLVIAPLCLALAGNGCSGTQATPSASKTNAALAGSGGDPSASASDGGTPRSPDAGRGTDVACFDADYIMSFEPPPAPPEANQGKCANDDVIAQFTTTCLTWSGAGVSADNEACIAFSDANASCASCLAAAPHAPWPAFIPYVNTRDGVPAVAACVAAISTGTDTCKSSYATRDLCARGACRPCDADDFASCVTAEMTDPASTCAIQNPLDDDCTLAIAGVSVADADSKCAADATIQSSADFDAAFMRVAKTLCE